MVLTFVQKTFLLFILIASITLTLQDSDNEEDATFNEDSNQVYEDLDETTLSRQKRFINKKKLGFFGLLGQLIYEQINETTSAYRQISELLNSQFSDSNEIVATTISSDPNATTTEAPFRLSRAEFLAILRRNIRGLNKLYRIEINEAMNHSRISYREFKQQLGLEFAKALAPSNTTNSTRT